MRTVIFLKCLRSISFFLFCVFPTFTWALTLPERPTGYVNDYAGLISHETRARLEERLFEFERTDSTQIVVAIFSSLDGGNVEDVGIRLADKWKIGKRGRDNGVLLLVFAEDRALRIETGYGLEGRLTDAVASDIIRNVIVPRFREGRYDEGITAGVVAIVKAVRGAYQGEPVARESERRGLGLTWLIFLLLFFFFIFPRRRRHTRLSRLGLASFLLGSGGLFGGRHGGFGGFGGGGGRFGGGGASGRW